MIKLRPPQRYFASYNEFHRGTGGGGIASAVNGVVQPAQHVAAQFISARTQSSFGRAVRALECFQEPAVANLAGTKKRLPLETRGQFTSFEEVLKAAGITHDPSLTGVAYTAKIGWSRLDLMRLGDFADFNHDNATNGRPIGSNAKTFDPLVEDWYPTDPIWKVLSAKHVVTAAQIAAENAGGPKTTVISFIDSLQASDGETVWADGTPHVYLSRWVEIGGGGSQYGTNQWQDKATIEAFEVTQGNGSRS